MLVHATQYHQVLLEDCPRGGEGRGGEGGGANTNVLYINYTAV